MKKLFTKEFVIGISVIIAIVILYVGIDYLKGVNLFKPANYYVAAYDNVAGLEVASSVTIDGYKVGQVREINFDYENHGKIKVILALNKSLRLPVDSKAVICTTLMSGAYIDIKMGSSRDYIEVGGDIGTQVNPDMMATLTDNVLPAVGDIIPKVDSLLVSLNRLAGDPALLKSVQNLERITDNINTATVSLNSVMGRQVPGLIGNVSHVANNLDTITHDLAVLSAELKRLPIESTMNNVNEVTDNLAKFSDRLNNNESTLGMLMNDPELYNRITRLSADVDSLILDIQRNPKRYISIKLL